MLFDTYRKSLILIILFKKFIILLWLTFIISGSKLKIVPLVSLSILSISDFVSVNFIFFSISSESVFVIVYFCLHIVLSSHVPYYFD